MSKSVTRPLVELEFNHNGDRLLHLLRKQHPDYHPILNIAKIAHEAETTGGGPEGNLPNRELALRAHTTVLRYVEPELKSVEVTIGNKNNRVIEVSLFDDAEPAKNLIKSLEEAEATSMVIDAELTGEPANDER